MLTSDAFQHHLLTLLTWSFPYPVKGTRPFGSARRQSFRSQGAQGLCSVTVRTTYSASIEKKEWVRPENTVTFTLKSWVWVRNHEKKSTHANKPPPFQMLYMGLYVFISLLLSLLDVPYSVCSAFSLQSPDRENLTNFSDDWELQEFCRKKKRIQVCKLVTFERSTPVLVFPSFQ